MKRETGAHLKDLVRAAGMADLPYCRGGSTSGAIHVPEMLLRGWSRDLTNEQSSIEVLLIQTRWAKALLQAAVPTTTARVRPVRHLPAL